MIPPQVYSVGKLTSRPASASRRSLSANVAPAAECPLSAKSGRGYTTNPITRPTAP